MKDNMEVGIEMDSNERLVTAILTQAVTDAKYTGIRKYYLKQKIEAINWIMTNDPKFDYYCKLLNIEPSYIINKVKKHTDTRITRKQRVILIPIVKALLKSKSYNTPPRPQAKEVLHG